MRASTLQTLLHYRLSKAFCQTLVWLAALGAALLAYDPFTPYLLVIRPWILPIAGALLAVGVLCTWSLAAQWRARQKPTHSDERSAAIPAHARSLSTTAQLVECVVLTGLFTCSAVAIGWQAWTFSNARKLVLTHSSSSPALTTLGRHFIISYRDFDEAATLTARGAIAGIYLRSANVQGKTPFQIRTEIMALQRLRQRNGLPPLIIAADQEGGAVQHMSPPLPSRPALAQLLVDFPNTLQEEVESPHSPKASADALLAVYAYGAEQGQELRSLGVNLNFGPVTDLTPTNNHPITFDTHTQLDRRTLSASPYVVAEATSAYIHGLQHSGVQATLKHFPGLSRTRSDTHHFSATVEAPTSVLNQTDWIPFRQTMPQAAAIMLGHVTLTDLDPSTPASLSARVVSMLRHEWHYQGLFITDDINMGALYHHFGICESTKRALNAGVDLVLIAYDSEQFYPAMACALDALDRGELQLRQSPKTHQRIARWFKGSVTIEESTPNQQLASQDA
ncbi:glycoside hydrolase family 3 N-terminal domain-containing protein [Lampropedia puyangensis]|nr:glycoside hydrolase family 3 N-terminal domain-containing protein [Lampropedia puyangensis]